jgi:hypothetical protein
MTREEAAPYLAKQQDETLTVRDKRGGKWWWAHNCIIDDFGPHLGPYGLAVYFALCRHSDNNNQDCDPSVATLAHETGMSTNKVRAALKTMERLGLIEIERRKVEAKLNLPSIYTLREPDPTLIKGTSPRAVPHHVEEGTSPREGKQDSVNKTNDDDARAPKPRKTRAKQDKPVAAPTDETQPEVEYTLDEYKLTLQRLGVSGVNVSILAEKLFRARLPITTPGELLAAAEADAQAHGERIHLPGAWLSTKAPKFGWDYSKYPAQSWAGHTKPARVPSNGSTGYGARRPEHPTAPPLPFPTDDTVAGYLPPEQRRALRAEARRDAQERLNGRTA